MYHINGQGTYLLLIKVHFSAKAPIDQELLFVYSASVFHLTCSGANIIFLVM
jgi:hypothetical protein